MPTGSRSSSRKRTHAATRPETLGPLVDWLAGIGTTKHWVVSCYLKLEPRDRERGKYQIKLKNRIRERLAWLDAHDVTREAREAVGRDLDRLQRYLADPANLPVGRGIALFACEPLDLWEVFPLPQVFRSRLAIDRSPLVRELAALHDEFGLMLCAVYDRQSARFFRVSPVAVEELPALTASDATRAGKFHGARVRWGAKAGGASVASGEHNYHQRIREEKHRHYARIAERLFQLASADGQLRGIVLAGTGGDAGAVQPHLHPYIGKQVLGTARLNPKTVTPAAVLDAVLEVRRESERTWEREHIDALQESLGTGWAVNGIEPTLGALARGQVRTLLVDPMAQAVGYRCTDGGGLVLDAADCHAQGTAESVPDLIDEAIEEALRQGGHVDVVEDNTARQQVDGLAGLLRFPL